MSLSPKLPPGRANRKALAFAAEIHRLRAAGYTFSAIRLALADVGIQVGCTTVKREAAKWHPAQRPLVTTDVPQPKQPERTLIHEGPPLERQPAMEAVSGGDTNPKGRRSGKDIAEAFMKDRITNPLLKEGTRHEDRSDQLFGERRQDDHRPSLAGASRS